MAKRFVSLFKLVQEVGEDCVSITVRAVVGLYGSQNFGRFIGR